MNKVNFDNLMTELLRGGDKKVLLHCCCGPCATACVERLTDKCDLALFWYNPNIMPVSERGKRLANLTKVSAHFGVKLIQGQEDEEDFIAVAKGLEAEKEGGARCDACFYLRLLSAAQKAKELGYEYFCSTLTVSPHKDSDKINLIAQKIAEQVGVKWLFSDFKKREGFKRSIELSKELGLYRQDYCGCAYGKQGEN
jgi:hypothetical protein